jgi:isoquinoline 1-oxidoreductase beta subunit
MGAIGTIARRSFLVGAAAFAGGLAVGAILYRRPYPNPLLDKAGPQDAVFNPFVKIGSDGVVTVIVPRAEMGQGVRTTLAAMVAEELDVSLSAVRIEHGPASYAYYNATILADGTPFAAFDQGLVAETMRGAAEVAGKFLGIQGTGASTSVKDAYIPMREAGAAARLLLVSAAAERLGVDAASLSTADGAVVHQATGRVIPYGELAAQAAQMPLPGKIPLRPASEWKMLGRPQPRVDTAAKCNGAAVFGIDIKLPDLLFATVRMNPQAGGGMKGFDATKAMEMPGFVKAVDIGSGVGVIATSTWQAFKAVEAISVEWTPPETAPDTASLFEAMAKEASFGNGFAFRSDGDAEAILSEPSNDAGEVIEAEYRAPFLAHACLEPMNATAQWKDGKLTVWTGTQVPTLVQMIGAREFGVEAEAVEVHVPFLGGGFGRRLEADYALYAMRIARHTDGRPVKVTWTREEDTQHDMYRPGAIGRFRARISKAGGPQAVDGVIASPSIIKSVIGRFWPYIPAAGPDKLIAEGAFDQPYAIPHYRIAGAAVECAIPVGFWRSVGNSYNSFFHETFMDEIAVASGMDPVALRLERMRRWPAAVKAVEKVAEMSDWGSTKSQGTGKGVTFTLSFGSWVAQVAQVTVVDDAIRIDKVWCAADVGRALDPGIIEAQMQSGILFGLAAAIGQEITFENGRTVQSNFHDFPMLSLEQAPDIEVAILQNAEDMGGVGEPGMPPSIPALGNAIFAATGKRLRDMPFSKHVRFVSR